VDDGSRYLERAASFGRSTSSADLGRRDVAEGAVENVVRAAAARAGIEKTGSARPAPHVRARLCHLAGGELEQIQFLSGHVSVQTTERYLGCKRKLRCAVNDRLGIEPDAAA
jgi:site-specific recombinase XerD